MNILLLAGAIVNSADKVFTENVVQKKLGFQIQMNRQLYHLDATNAISLYSQNLTTPLHLASENGNIQSVKLLLQHNATVNAIEKVPWLCMQVYIFAQFKYEVLMCAKTGK